MLLEISRAFDCTGLTNHVLYITHTLCVTWPEHTQICPHARPHGSHIHTLCKENRFPVHSDMVHKRTSFGHILVAIRAIRIFTFFTFTESFAPKTRS